MINLIKKLITRIKNRKQHNNHGIKVFHPKDLGLRPVKSEYIMQYRVRRGRWLEVKHTNRALPRKRLRMWRKDTYRVGEGFRSSDGNIIPNGTYTSYEYLGPVDPSMFNLHHGQFTPETFNTPERETRPAKTYGKPRKRNPLETA